MVQRQLDQKVKLNTFMDDVNANSKDKEMKTALQRLLAAARRTKLEIKYDWLKAKVTSRPLSTAHVNSLTKNLESLVGEELDRELSGERGHLITRHVLVGKEYQEERLAGGLAKATRVTYSGKEGTKYMLYITSVKATAPDLVKTHVENVSYNVLMDMKKAGGAYATATTNPTRKTAIEGVINERTLQDDGDHHTIDYTWTVKVITPPGAGANPNVTLTCEPTLTSNEGFRKTATETGRDETTVESQEYAPVVMYWGSNKIKLEGLTPATTADALQGMVDDLDFKLGVTQF